MSYQHYNLLAELFRYPTTGFKEKLDDFKNEIIALFPDSISFITDFNIRIKELSLHQSEEDKTELSWGQYFSGFL